MKIVHVYHYYYPVIGGMERAVQGLAEAHAELGHEVHVVTSTYTADSRPREEMLNNVYVHRVDAWRIYYSDLIIPRYIPKDILRKADIVHVHDHNSFFNMKFLKEAFKLKAKIACYLMAVNTFKSHPNPVIRLLAPIYDRSNIKKVSMMADLCLVKNLRDKTILEKKYGVKAECLPDGLPGYYFSKSQSDSTHFLEKFKIRHEKIFLFIGRIHKLKGPHILVRALKYLDKDIGVVLVGPDNGYLSKTLKLAEKLDVRSRVYYLGCLNEEDKIQAIDSSIAIVLPSITDRVEVYPMVVSEAWAREKPVIASRVGGVPFRVKHGVCGLLVDPGEPRALAEAMAELARNRELAENIGRQCKDEVFTWRAIALRSIDLYKDILSRDSEKSIDAVPANLSG